MTEHIPSLTRVLRGGCSGGGGGGGGDLPGRMSPAPAPQAGSGRGGLLRCRRRQRCQPAAGTEAAREADEATQGEGIDELL